MASWRNFQSCPNAHSSSRTICSFSNS
ncbi:hypothetical protein NXF25_007277 [Crotalus adamanteus]|uniref:Uncharacterized protein n=1 Tax=Crotalus adamanteus TaxID=8729 RepID=A0AAW1C2E9_CROAD